jgi:hypothetical protein
VCGASSVRYAPGCMGSVTEPPIYVRNLTKVFRVHEREEGLVATLRSLFKRGFKSVPAVQDVTFEMGEGEVVGFSDRTVRARPPPSRC